VEIDAEILARHAEGREHGRLRGRPSLELLRTPVLLDRFLPGPPARVLDVGGASGVYASRLAPEGTIAARLLRCRVMPRKPA
jgi:hypothetical protein